MEARESAADKEPVKEKVPLQRKWASEPSATTNRGGFVDPDVRLRESLLCGDHVGSAPQQKYAIAGNSGKLQSGPSVVGAIGGPPSQDPQDPFAQGFPRGYTYQVGPPYPQHPQTERFLSGAKPQPGLEPHAWPFAGQLPSDDLYPVGHPGHTHPHGGGTGRFSRQKSPSLPSSFGQYTQSGPEAGEEGYSKKEQKPKKPGKYKCHYCGRACAKPSVLKKHIRSHTGERPYPCEPCGFSFKTKSNLYKHRKSHAHAIKAGLVPFSEIAMARGGDVDQASPGGEAEVHSDGEQSTDTDEEGVEGSTMLMDKDSPIPQISFEDDKNTGGAEPAYADSAEELPVGSIKVPILIVPKSGRIPSTGLECPSFHDIKLSHPHHMLVSQVGVRSHSLDESPTIKQRLALRLTEKKGQEESAMTQSLNLLSPHSKGSTDSGYFSRSESAEQQISPPNTNVKSYEEIMFGRTWYYRPNSRSRHSITVGLAGADPASLASLKQSGAILDMGKIAEDHSSFKGDVGDPKQYPTGPCQSSTGLLEPPSESAHLIRCNSMPTSSPPNLSVPPSVRGSHSFDDEMMTSDDVFYPQGLRRLRRQAAFEHSAAETHGGEADGSGHIPKNLASSLAMKIGERTPEHVAYGPYGTKVSISEIATRKRRKEKSEGDEEDSPGHGDSSCSGSVEMTGDYEFKQSSLDGCRATPTGKGSFSAHSQSDSFDTCASMCSEDMSLFVDSESRKAAGNVISVIQHTNSLSSRPNSFDKSESFDQPGYHSFDKGPQSQYSEQSDTEIFEDALSPESALQRTESMDQQLHSDSDLASLSSSSAAASPGQPYQVSHKLVRQPNIQVPEIRVTEEPDKPEKDAEVPKTKEPDKQQQPHVEEFQLPQRSDTLSQMPSEKLPPKKKRLRLTDMEHSSGESSFESTCTSLSRSPSQESNLSHSSSFSMSFDREEGLKSLSPTKQDDSAASGSGTKQSEFLTVPGSHSSHHQLREMRRSSSEQAPCTLPMELPEMRSKSFDYGSLSPSRQGEVYSSTSAMKERRRGYLVRQASLSVYPEVVPQEPGAEMSVKQESLEHGSWSGPTGSAHISSDITSRSRRAGSSGSQQHHQHLLQQSFSEDSLQDEPLYGRSQQYRLQAQGSSSDGEHPGHEGMSKDVTQPYQSGPGFLSYQSPGLFWSQEAGQAPRQQQLQKLQMRSSGMMTGYLAHKQPHDGRSENPSFSSRTSPLSPNQQNFGTITSKLSLHTTTTTTSVILQQIQPVFATQNLGSQPSQPGMLVPVRIQTHVPSFGSVMYTSVSQLMDAHGRAGLDLGGGTDDCIMSPSVGVSKPSGGNGGAGFNLSHFLGQSNPSVTRIPLWKVPDSLPEQRLNTGIPLSLTSGTISTTDASGSSVGGGKRMLSPTSSLELFIETKQQKRVKEERMYGQILKEMSAVELSGAEGIDKAEKRPAKGRRGHPNSDGSMDDSPSPLNDFSVATRIAVPVRSSAPQPPDVPRAESFTPPLQIVTDRSPAGRRDSPEELDVDDSTPEPSTRPMSRISSNEAEDCDNTSQPVPGKVSASVLGAGGSTQLLTDVTEVQQYLLFPSLRTMSKVSWCFLKYTKPNSSQTGLHGSVYSSWTVNSYNPNPLNLSTKAALALLRSKQRKNTDLVYTTAVVSPPSSGKLVSSVAWKLRFDQLKPELIPVEFGRKMKGVVSWDRSKEEQVEKEVSVKQPATEPSRIKIFEGGYKSNEDYVYVRGRGRGKYICEECGIRCKKPSMLKKHIRTHTDVRPYVCKFCNFAFKTKGNLTKHMKSKAHVKKCLELGVSMSSLEDTEGDEGEVGDDGPRSSEKIPRGQVADHQFSDADDSEGGEDDGDEVDDEDDEEDDYDGDSTPKTHSRSTSPQPFGLPGLSITAVASSQSSHHPDLKPPPLFGYFTTVPSIHITTQAPPSDPAGRECPSSFHPGQQRAQGIRLLAPPSSSSMDEDFPDVSSPSSSSRLSSPGLDHSGCPSPISPASSPCGRRYLSPRRDLSPCARHLSPRRDLSPRRHISPKRELAAAAVAAGYLRDVSPRRGHMSLLSPLSRPTSPGGRDLKRDLSPRGRHRGVIRPLSPRRGLHQHLHHLSPQSVARSLRPSHQLAALSQGEFLPLGRRRNSADMEMELNPNPPGECGRSSPPHQLLFSHLPLHSQLQVRSPYPMIPIGGIQMVQSVPSSAQQGATLQLQRRAAQEESASREPPGGGAAAAAEWASPPHPQRDGSGVRVRQEEGVQTCTKAIASLCLHSEERGGGGGGEEDRGGSPPTPPPDLMPSTSHSPPPPPHLAPPQHFSGLELLPPPPPSSSSPGPPPPPPAQTPGGGGRKHNEEQRGAEEQASERERE